MPKATVENVQEKNDHSKFGFFSPKQYHSFYSSSATGKRKITFPPGQPMLQIHALRPCGLQKQTRSTIFPFWTDRRCRNEGEIPCLECSPSSTLLPQSHHCPGTEPFLLHLGICPSHSWGTSLPRTVHRCCLEREKKKKIQNILSSWPQRNVLCKWKQCKVCAPSHCTSLPGTCKSRSNHSSGPSTLMCHFGAKLAVI